MKKTPPIPPSRPLRLEWVEAGSLTDNPANWRCHPEGQMTALRDVIGDPDVGWAGALLFNEKTKRLIDGHGRKRAVSPTTPVPVLIGQWSEEAEKKILLTLDPIGSMAVSDDESLSSIIGEVDFTSDAICDLIDSIRPEAQAEGSAGDSRDNIAKQANAKVRVVLAVDDLRIVERALAMSGINNRGEALATICREYEKRQLDI